MRNCTFCHQCAGLTTGAFGTMRKHSIFKCAQITLMTRLQYTAAMHMGLVGAVQRDKEEDAIGNQKHTAHLLQCKEKKKNKKTKKRRKKKKKKDEDIKIVGGEQAKHDYMTPWRNQNLTKIVGVEHAEEIEHAGVRDRAAKV